jgi:acetolactate synthase I/II/III large subunit
VIREMIDTPRPVICDVVVDRAENVYPMIPGGAAHNEIKLCPDDAAPVQGSEEGMVLV